MFLDIFNNVCRRHLYDELSGLLIKALEADASEPCIIPMLTLISVFGLDFGDGIIKIKFVHIHINNRKDLGLPFRNSHLLLF